MKASELLINMKVYTLSRGEGKVIGRTPFTVTVKFPKSTVKWNFKKDATLKDLELLIDC